MITYVRKGRGAPSNETGRFEKLKVEYDDDVFINPKTTFFKDTSKSIISTNDSPDLGFSMSVNPYRGCEHGCVYCYARPTHEYFGFSAGVDFETKILVKQNAPQLLYKEIMSENYKPDTIFLSGVTDCYQPAEKKFELTRGCISVLSEFRNPFIIVTKNQLVTRDIDILAPMSKINAAKVVLSVTTLDAELGGVMEPRASRPELRLKAIRELRDNGVSVGVNVAPIIPGLTDHEIPDILSAAKDAGATFANFTIVRLPHSVKDIFQEWLDHHYPNKKNKILNRIRSLRGGKLYKAEFGTRMKGEGEFSEMVATLFDRYCKKLGLNEEKRLVTTEHFRKPGEQLSLGI